MYLRNLLTRQGDKTALLVEQTRRSPRRKYPAGVRLHAWGEKLPTRLRGRGKQTNGVQAANTTRQTPHTHETATCRCLTVCMSKKASSSLLQTMEAAPKHKMGCLVEQTFQGTIVLQ